MRKVLVIIIAAALLNLLTGCECKDKGTADSTKKTSQLESENEDYVLKLVPTFHCISVYYRTDTGSHDVPCSVTYKKEGSEEWEKGLDLVYDSENREYRGSLVNLAPGTLYTVKVSEEGGKEPFEEKKATLDENFPVAKTIIVPEFSDTTFKIKESGTPDGYVLYTPEEGKEAIIDIGHKKQFGLTVQAQYVIIRGINIKNPQQHGIIFANGSHHVVIENCDISGWGSDAGDGWGRDFDSAIFGEGEKIDNLIIQRNRFHDPATDSNSWEEARKAYNDEYHPAGPQVVTLNFGNKGRNIIRYNSVYSDENHCFNDAFGGAPNFSNEGFPGPDSDIYGNYIERCWDNAIEAEGGGMNVRIWGNYIDTTYSAIAFVPVSLGPIYIWRNVVDRSRKGPSLSSDEDPRGRIKAGSSQTDSGKYYGDGRIFFFHNTLYQRKAPEGMKYPLGCSAGLDGSAGIMTSVVSRNNILHVYKDEADSIYDNSTATEGENVNDFDYDLYNGKIVSPIPQEKNGIKGSPIYDSLNGELEFFLDSKTPGVDSGIRIDNFNDNAKGNGPDVGAWERGNDPLEYGVEAYIDK